MNTKDLISAEEATKITHMLFAINRIIESNTVVEKQAQLCYLYGKVEGKVLCLLNKIAEESELKTAKK